MAQNSSKKNTNAPGSNANVKKKTSDTASSRNTANTNNNKPKPVPTKQQAAQNIAMYAKQLLKLSRDMKGATANVK